MDERSKGKVLVVDDEAHLLFAFSRILSVEEYSFVTARTGEEALSLFHKEDPDLILCDLFIPGAIDGFEVCRRIKAMDPFRPVLLLSGSIDSSVGPRAFLAGADGFLNKPLRFSEVEMRLRAAMNMRRARQRVEHLEELKDELVQMLVHDLKNPVAGIVSNLELIRMDEANNLTPEGKASLEYGIESAWELSNLVSDILSIRLLEGEDLPISSHFANPSEVLSICARRFSFIARRAGVNFKTDGIPSNHFCSFDPKILDRIVSNLLMNALQFTPSGGSIRLSLSGRGILVTDSGPGIPDELKERIFDRFSRASLRDMGWNVNRGLGLTFVKAACKAMGGRVSVSDAPGPGGGANFIVELPGLPAEGASSDSAANIA